MNQSAVRINKRNLIPKFLDGRCLVRVADTVVDGQRGPDLPSVGEIQVVGLDDTLFDAERSERQQM